MATSEKQGIPAVKKGPSVLKVKPAVVVAVSGVVKVYWHFEEAGTAKT